MIKELCSLLVGLLMLAGMAVASPSIEVKGLFSGSAVLVIDGKQRLLKKGKTSPEGVTLVSADSKAAVVEVAGQRHTLTLSKTIGGSYRAPAKAIVRLQSGRMGHYLATGSINGRSVKFMVDTGASAIALNSIEARRLGIDYEGKPQVGIATASGNTPGYQVLLPKVTVGAITLNNVLAIVIEGSAPNQILLGNTFLSRVDMRVEGGVLVLQAKY